jgi:WD40 repeat protein
VAFLPDGLRVLTGSQDNTAKLWDAVTGKEILTLKGHSQEVTCVTTSTNGRYVLTGSRDGTAIVWLASAGTIVAPATASQTSLRKAP